MTMNGPVDLETLIWEARELIRDLSKVSKAQSAEIERLGGRPWEGAHELQERADGAVASCDTALEQWLDDSQSSIGGCVDVAAWLDATRKLQEEEMAAGETDNQGDISFVSANSSFWRPEGFNWADEPATNQEEEEEEDTSNSVLNVPELLHDLDDSGRFDGASDSEDSFVSAEILAHNDVDSEAGETACNEALASRSRRHSFSDALTTNIIVHGDCVPQTEAIKGSPYPPSLCPKAGLHPRRATRIESLPNMDRLVALQE